jgi:hypothetical protein
MQNNPIEKCVICGKDTHYRFNDHIDMRIGYIEGSGQGCYQPSICEQARKNSLISISEQVIHETPNDLELGAKVRRIYWNHKNR